MKQQRLRIKLLALLLFAMFLLLGVYCVFNVLNNGNRWFSSRWNPRIESQKATVAAGDILDRNGEVLASNDEETGNRIYHPNAKIRSALVHVVGDEQGYVSHGVETFQTSYLYGFQSSLSEMLTDLLSGKPRRGDSVQLTIDYQLQTAIVEMFANNSETIGHNGSAVVLNWRTGEMLAMVSLPVFDPQEAKKINSSGNAEQYFTNRATEKLYTPGSILQTMTAVSAIEQMNGAESGKYNCTGILKTEGGTIGELGGTSHGSVNLQEAYVQSCNTMFAQLAQRLGNERLQATAHAFGFNDNLLFRDLVVENSSFPADKTEYGLAAESIGQASVLTTPMHMSMMASAIANDGVMQEPRLLLSVISPSGKMNAGYQMQAYRRACSAETAYVLKQYMRNAVTRGTASRADVSGMMICGKNGESAKAAGSDEWFIGFNDDENLPFAVCIVVENAKVDSQAADAVAAGIFEWLRDHADRVTGTVIEPTWMERIENVAAGWLNRLTEKDSTVSEQSEQAENE